MFRKYLMALWLAVVAVVAGRLATPAAQACVDQSGSNFGVQNCYPIGTCYGLNDYCDRCNCSGVCGSGWIQYCVAQYYSCQYQCCNDCC
jgi:hypothetical protein